MSTALQVASVQDVDTSKALAQLHDMGGLREHIDVMALDRVQLGCLDKLNAQGVLSLQRDDFGSWKVGLRAGAITFRSLQVLSEPLGAFRVHFSVCVVACPKLY